MNDQKITVSTTVYAPIERVWNCWVDSAHIVHWNFASVDWHCPRAANDLKPGGTYVARMEAKDGSMGFDFIAIYDEVVQHEKISYTMEDARVATTVFIDKGDHVEVSTVFDAESTHPLEMQKAGWQAIMDNYKKYTEEFS